MVLRCQICFDVSNSFTSVFWNIFEGSACFLESLEFESVKMRYLITLATGNRLW